MNPSRLKQRLRELNWSYTKFADKSGVSESTIKRALGGSAPNRSTIELMAKALDTTVDWLCGEDKPTTSSNEPAGVTVSPNNEPDEPIEMEDDREMIAALQHVINNYKERICDLKEAHTDRVNSLTRDKIALSIACGILIVFILVLFAYDILNPSVGWFRY